jgi:dATP pyrophosphohydrolase
MARVKVRVVDAYVYRKTGDKIKYLILKRARTKMYEHLWQGVAGKIEKGEQAWQAAIRELKEETGLDPIRIFVADHVSKFYETHGDRVNLVPVFGIEVDSDIISLSREHSDFKWVDYDSACSYLVWRGQKKGIYIVNEMIISNDDRMKWSQIDLT